MKLTDKQLLILLGAGVVVFFYAKGQAGEVAQAVNPLNNENVFYQFAGGVTQAITGRKTDNHGRPLTLGAWLAGS